MSKLPHPIEAVYQSLILQYIDPWLTDNGFVRSGKFDYRQGEGDVVWHVDFLFTKQRGVDAGTILVSLAIGFRSIANFLSKFPFLNTKKTRYPGLFGSNLGTLGPRGNYYEWELAMDTHLEQLGDALITEIERYGLPFLAKYGDIPNALQLWLKSTYSHSECPFPLSNQVEFYVAAAHWLNNERKQAIEFMQERIAYYDSLVRRNTAHYNERDLGERQAFLRLLGAMH